MTITRHGRPVAVLVHPDALRTRRAERALGDAERLQAVLDEGRAAALDTSPTLTATRADQLAADVAAGRAPRTSGSTRSTR